MTTDARRPLVGRRAVVILGVVCLLGLVVGALAVRNALLAAQDLQTAKGVLQELDAEGIDLDAALPALDDAQDLVARADRRLSRPSVTVLRWVPVAGRSVIAERAVVQAAGSSLAGVRALADAAPGLRADGGVDVDALRSLADGLLPLASAARADLADLRTVRTEWTPARVGEAVQEVDSALTPVVDDLVQAASGADLAAGLLGERGPRNLLVALGNNAELRGTGGYVSTFATGRIEDGRLELDPFRDVVGVGDPPGAARKVPAPPEYVEDFGPFLADTTLFREWTMSPDTPDAASVASGAIGALLGVAPDIVLLLDVPALTAIVGLAGDEISLPDGSAVPADQLTEALLVDTYAAAGDSREDQDARRAALRAAAGDTAAALLTGDVEPLPLVRELGRLADGRHLALWSADAAEQEQLERLGLAGSADPEGDDLALVSVNNLNANKLDYYVDRTVDVQATVGRDSVEVLQRLVLTNRAPQDLVPYVAGTESPGTVVERVEFSVAQSAQVSSFQRDGAPTRGEVRTGSERTRVHTYVELPRGASTTLELRYTVPVADGHYRLRLLPQPLAVDAELTVTVVPAPGLSMSSSDGDDAGPIERSAPWVESEVVDVVVR